MAKGTIHETNECNYKNNKFRNVKSNNSVDSMGEENKTSFDKNLDKYIDFASWMIWFPDLFLDLIAPQEGGIKLHADQRIYLRSICRFMSTYGVFPRGYGKTFNEVLAMFIVAIRYPDIELSMTAQTKENAAEILKDKVDEIIKFYPMMENEISYKKFSKNDAEVKFVNGSRVD